MDNEEDEENKCFGQIEQMQRERKEALEREEVDKAEKLISQRYPLNYLKLTEVFSILRPFSL